MSRSTLLAGALIVIVTLWAPSGKAETFERYTDMLASHPSVTHILEKSVSLDSLAKNALGLPDPQLILGVDNIPLSAPSFNRFLPSSKVIGFRQIIPNPTVRKNKANLQKSLSEKQQLMAEYQIKQLKALFVRQLIELEKVGKLEALLKEKLKLYQLMEKDLRGQLEAGKSVYGQFSEIDVERAGVEQQLNVLQEELTEIQETLIELVETVPQISPPGNSALEWIRNETPLYPTLIAHEEITIHINKIDIAQAQFKPNYGIQALYKQREAGDTFEGDDWFSIQASVTIPLWSKSNQTPQLESAKALMRSAQSAHEQSVRHWSKKMLSLEARQKYAIENIKLFKRKKAALQEVIAAAERNYESGKTALKNVLYAQINWISIASMLVKQESRYQILVTEFNSHIRTEHDTVGGSHEDL